MKFILYKYSENTEGRSLSYVTGIQDGRPMFSKYSTKARRYSLLNVVFLSLKLGLSWVNERYIRHQ